jgi:DNA-binding MarR family transcriptional regulator
MPHLLLKDLPPLECLIESAREYPELDPSATDVFLNVLATSDELYAAAERSFATHNITQGRFCVMMLLLRSTQPRAAKLVGADGCAGGPRTPAELAEAAGVTRATMTGLIDTLERDGLVKREPDPVDRRMMSVRLTPKAEELMRSFMPGHFRVIAGLMDGLSEAERQTLVGLLKKIQARTAELAAAAKAEAPVSIA